MRISPASGLAIALIRVGEYLRVFGFKGLSLAFLHFVRLKLAPAGKQIATNIPGWGRVLLRPKTSDLATFREIFINGEYDARRNGIMPFLQQRYAGIIAAGRVPLIVDAGANVGLATVFLTRFFPRADYLLIEANPDNAAAARANCAMHCAARVVEAALWDRSGTIYLSRSEHASTNTVREHTEKAEDLVKTVTMDEVIAGREEDLFLVKMDIEGAEARVLAADGAAWLKLGPVVMIEPHDGVFNDRGSLAGLLAYDSYRNGKIILSGTTVLFVPFMQPT